MKLTFSERSWAAYLYWQEHDAEILEKINVLIRDAKRSPFSGLGKPEPLKNELKGWWSRRINREHRLIYRVVGTGDDQTLEIATCRFHY
ncbi:Txe/YoeB family addiction module toxin [Methylopila turkensis]|uniref:Putative mRNA interferase YoeB n=1 Tax=Methylopila turkensis TaxID=1437816 RepID=A0A9W6JQN5_9HYPH|nr:Txe/YoeB family addiction module toxin [Methylopila turkensis]GLK81517.1 addiction module protein [Methylopila turkensis]